ncbi:MAG: HoxN/HupN/NixA family nickel/cobalt transporter [Acetobacteraceae bacterium]|nr:HoxN/HupN/NixA family nickel/cobalt transporter [Acetobacteraceae bacterium]
MTGSRHDGRGRLSLLFAALVAANAGAWMWAWTLFADRPALLGTALLAWVFGLRHAVDADHIAAIDNVVRKLMQEGRRPIGAGLFFSLGHSTIVFLACLGVAVTASALDLDRIKLVGETIGTAVSATFLLVIALANLAILRGVWRSFRHVRRGGALSPDGAELAGGGLLARLFRPLFGVVRRSWQMYPLGFLFGLGFDTATEVGLLAIAATEAAQGLGHWQILVFPALFTAGMALVDTADSVLMVEAYGWAFVHPLRKLWYNLTITAASVAVALLIGGIEALGLLAERFGLDGSVWSAVAALNDDLADLGFVVVGIFVLAWGLSAAIYRWRGYDAVAGRSGR